MVTSTSMPVRLVHKGGLAANGEAAFQHVRENIEALNGRVGADDTDLIFLKGLMDSPIMKSLVKVQDKLEDSVSNIEPVSTGNVQLTAEVRERCATVNSQDAQELSKLLNDPYLQALIESHDIVANKTYEPPKAVPESSEIESLPPVNGMPTDAIRMVGLRKNPDEPLGLTVRIENSELVIARILGGGMIDRQGLLHEGDIIKEVNGVSVSTPEELQSEIAKLKESVTLKIKPSYSDQSAMGQVKTKTHKPHGVDGPRFVCYMKALYDYDPAEDTLLPCPEVGLQFFHGDILQVVNRSDPNWWQAKKVGSNGPAGLVPSQELEERRKAYVRPEADFVHKIGICGTKVSKKKRKMLYQSKQNADFDKAELLLYEEVTRMPPFKRKTLVLIGSQGVGRRTLKNRIINCDPDRFGAIIPSTSRPMRELEEDGKGYWFITREDFEQEIKDHKFLEYGEHNSHLYGSKLSSVRSVIREGKMCVLDCSPVALKILHNSPDFMPYVVFLAAPGMEQLKYLYDYGRYHGGSDRNLTFDRSSSLRLSSRRARTLESLASLYEEEDLRATLEESARLQRAYEQYFDLVVVNEDFDTTFRKVMEAVEKLTNEHQWVPVSWVY